MRYLFILPTLLLLSCSTAQTGGPPTDAVHLLATHFGGKPTGTPTSLTWKPQGLDLEKAGYLPEGTVRTTVDTTLYPEPDLALVFFRTSPTRETSEYGSLCTLCEDQLGLAVYKKLSSDWKQVKFEKCFTKQGVYEYAAKPELVDAGRTGKVVRIISSDGEPEHSITSHQLFGLPGLRLALSIDTEVNEVERGGEDGPMGEPVNYKYRFIPSEKEWYDVEVEGDEGEMVRWVFSSATGTYVKSK